MYILFSYLLVTWITVVCLLVCLTYQLFWLCFCIRYEYNCSIFGFQCSSEFHTQVFRRTAPLLIFEVWYVGSRVTPRQAIRSDGRESIGEGLSPVKTGAPADARI